MRILFIILVSVILALFAVLGIATTIMSISAPRTLTVFTTVASFSVVLCCVDVLRREIDR